MGIFSLMGLLPYLLFGLLCVDIGIRYRTGKSATREIVALAVLGVLFYLSRYGVFYLYRLDSDFVMHYSAFIGAITWIVPLALIVVEVYRLARLISENKPGASADGVGTGVTSVSTKSVVRVILSILAALVLGVISFVVLLFVALTLWPPSE